VNTGSTRIGDHVHFERRRRVSSATAGYDIEYLAEQEHPSFLETAVARDLRRAAHRLGTPRFSRQIRLHTLVHEDVKRFYYGFPKDRAPDGGPPVGGSTRWRPSTRTPKIARPRSGQLSIVA